MLSEEPGLRRRRDASERDNFELRDEGKPQPTALFDNTPQPIRLIVMLDVSHRSPGEPHDGSDDDDDDGYQETDCGFFPSGVWHTTLVRQGWHLPNTPVDGWTFQALRRFVHYFR